jgi:hypothetical protein
MDRPPVFFRLHEWLADRTSWVQYPSLRVKPAVPVFKHPLPWSTRALLVLFAMIVLPLCAIALFFLGLLFWAMLTA